MRLSFRHCYTALILFFVFTAILSACSSKPKTGEGGKVSTLGTFEVTAELAEIVGDFPPNDLYDYAYVLKYDVLKVHRGHLSEKTIYVGQYNPLKPRETVADARSGEVGGDVKSFKTGDVHRMALDVPIDDFFMGGIINKYAETYSGPIYWARWTNQAAE